MSENPPSILDANASEAFSVNLNACPVLNYSLQQNGIAFLTELVIKNNTQIMYEQVDILFSFSPAFAKQTENLRIPIAAEEEVTLRRFPLTLDADFLASLTDRVAGSVTVCAKHGEEILFESSSPVDLLAFDECFGFWFMPELLSCFAQPSHPEIPKILYTASKLLEQWTGSPSLDAYQSEDRQRVYLHAAAIYGALQQCNITYAMPPAGYEKLGQRVRTVDVILRDHLGTCLDLALLYCACVEAAGLNPILVVIEGHAFAGVWLAEECFPETVQEDVAELSKRIASDIGSISLVETTALCAGKPTDYREAELEAQKSLYTKPFSFLVDIRRARASGLRPLPRRVFTDSGLAVVHEERPAEALTRQPGALSEPYLPAAGTHTPGDKFDQWQRKLLDLSKRNALISLRLTRTMLPVLTYRLDQLEDALQSGRDFRLLPKSEDWNFEITDNALFEIASRLGPYEEALRLDFSSGQIRVPYTLTELQKSITFLYRSARTTMEENGANTLFLALGALKWFETQNSIVPRYAPIILLPVEIIRKSASVGYVIRLRDEEPQMNITLLELMRQVYGISITSLDPLPQDDHGLDIRAILSTMRHSVMHMPRWDVVESAFLGNFSFAQFVMWNDMRNRTSDLKANKIVRSLEQGKLVWTPEPIASQVAENGTLLPIASDSSQQLAIQEASAGKSFVLHGPPGTGKSQTITAMIANCLSQGKAVLFVAEKMAALSVVKKRLDHIGLGPFCLELHSNKARKKDVLDQLEAALKMAGQVQNASYQATAKQKEALQAELSLHKEALHKVYPIGLTLYEAISRYEQFENAPETVHFSLAEINRFTAAQVQSNAILVDELLSSARLIGHPSGHPLTDVKLSVYTQPCRAQADSALAAAHTSLIDLSAAGKALCTESEIPCDETLVQGRTLLSLAKTLAELKQKRLERQAIEQHLLESFQPSVLSVPIDTFSTQWQQAQREWFLPKLIHSQGIVKQLAPYHLLGKLNAKQAAACLDALQNCATYLADEQSMISTLPQRLSAALDHAFILGETYAAAYTEWQRRWQTVEACLAIRPEWNQSLETFTAVQERLTLWHTHLGELRDVTMWNHMAGKACEAGLKPLVDALAQGLPLQQGKDAYHRGLYRGITEAIFAEDTNSSCFNGQLFEEKVRTFKHLDEELCRLAQQEIIARLASRLPNLQVLASQSSELGILQRAIRSGGRGVAIRKLMEQLPTLLPCLCPCMLMSPISTAQYLNPKRSPFDLVIFDEASQMPTCEAVGVLARAKEAVIVGDPKQMPPTSFFASNTSDEEHPELDDLESILDDCLALTMPDTHLKWHYRSRHESLIAFSNREFYDGHLFTFPSPDALCTKVQLIPVEGYYDRGKSRQNLAEGKAIVAEIERRLTAEPQTSIGVVTFSAVQQTLVEDLLNDLYLRRPDLETLALERDEPLFVKNLENVQGDERDVILFSVGYGPDENGVVAMNFGPLNREGGWRRLNVAITRAREAMIIFSVLRPDQIDLHRTRARGIESLKAFLEFAGKGTQTARASLATVQDGLAERIADQLSQKGYPADTEVGFSKFRVDVAVKDPHNAQQYVLGILLDGNSYASAQTVHDREVSNPSVLGNLGWQVLRVYAIDWWEDAPRELARIIAAIEGANSYKHRQTRFMQATAHLPIAGEHPAIPVTGGGTPSLKTLGAQQEAVTDVQTPLRHRRSEHQTPIAPIATATKVPTPALQVAPQETEQPYQLTVLPTMNVSAEQFLLVSDTLIMQHCMAVVHAEAPITENLLIRRVLGAFGITRAGSRMNAKVAGALRQVNAIRVEENGVKIYYTSDPNDFKTYRVPRSSDTQRDACDLPIAEVANAAGAVLRQQFGLPEEALIRETARLFGYSRIGTNVQEAMQAGIKRLIQCGRANKGEDGSIRPSIS